MTRLFAITALLLVIATAYQNCSRVRTTSDGQSTSTRMSGNGGTYDGKPAEGQYVRQNPQGCAKSSLIGVLQVTALQSRVTSDICTDMDYAISFQDTRLIYSQYNRDYIGVNSAIFEAAPVYNSAPEPVELWCRHVQANLGVDLVVKSGGQAYMYRGENLGTNNATVFPRESFNVQISKTASAVSVTSAGISGSVDLNSKKNGVFAGQITVSGSRLAVECRLLSREPAVYALPANILAMYQMDGALGTLSNNSQLSDSSQNSFRADVHILKGTGAIRISDGRFAQALHLGGHAYVDLPALAPAIGAEASVSMFLRPDAAISDDSVAFAVNSNAGANVIKIGTGMCSGTGDRLNLSLELGNLCYDTGKVIVDGQWHAVAATISQGRVVLYLDGVEVANQALVKAFASTDLWSLGTDYDVSLIPGDFWLGDIDEMTVWSVALPSAPQY